MKWSFTGLVVAVGYQTLVRVSSLDLFELVESRYPFESVKFIADPRYIKNIYIYIWIYTYISVI